jgi:hypothetical protein
VNDETEVLRNFLDTERDHVLGILEGLSEEQLRRPGTSARRPPATPTTSTQ